jgi:hypothetical protein
MLTALFLKWRFVYHRGRFLTTGKFTALSFPGGQCRRDESNVAARRLDFPLHFPIVECINAQVHQGKNMGI